MTQTPHSLASASAPASTPRRALPLLLLALLAPLGGCAVVDAAAGAAISVTGAVVSTGVTLTGKAMGAGIDALSSSKSAPGDNSGIVIRENIRPADAAPGSAATQPEG